MGAEKILILGGTKEAVELAETLVNEGHDVITSMAGRTREPKPPQGQLRIGGFGGEDGLARWMKEHKISRLIDATHPFAEQISRNAQNASRRAGIPLEIHQRPPWIKQNGDLWTEVSDLREAERSIPAGSNVLFALGSQHLAPFYHRGDCHFIVRMVDPPADPLPFPKHALVLGKPSFDPKEEARLLTDLKITHIVCRNSGGKGAYAKIEAARRLNLPVIIVSRPC